MALALRHIPNVITVIRILLVVPIAIALVQRQLLTTISLFALAAVSDGLDGYLARRFDWRSELGSILDPTADKLLLITVFITLGLERLVPLWLMVAAVLRDAVIVSGAAAYRFVIGPVRAQPSVVSKLNTLSQAIFILAVISRAAFGFPPPWVGTALGALVFVMIGVSGLDYVMSYSRRALAQSRGRARAA